MIAAFIPIKLNSERVKGKNFRLLKGKPLYEYVIDNAINAECFDDIFIDTDSDILKAYALSKNLKIIDRLPDLTKNTANGNDLMRYWYKLYPEYNLYFQLFATAPFLSSTSIKNAVNTLATSATHDSIFSAEKTPGWFWMCGRPVNFRTSILLRSQDALYLIKETTGLYGIKNTALELYQQRVGANPIPFIVHGKETIDIDSEEDFLAAKEI